MEKKAEIIIKEYLSVKDAPPSADQTVQPATGPATEYAPGKDLRAQNETQSPDRQESPTDNVDESHLTLLLSQTLTINAPANLNCVNISMKYPNTRKPIILVIESLYINHIRQLTIKTSMNATPNDKQPPFEALRKVEVVGLGVQNRSIAENSRKVVLSASWKACSTCLWSGEPFS